MHGADRAPGEASAQDPSPGHDTARVGLYQLRYASIPERSQSARIS